MVRQTSERCRAGKRGQSGNIRDARRQQGGASLASVRFCRGQSPVSNKSAVLPITPRSRLASPRAGSTLSRIAPAEFGARLVRGREQKKRSLEEIADATKISIHQLRVLERGDLHRLPAGIYRRAIVRQYAEAAGLNVEETIRDLESVSTEVDVDIRGLEPVAQPRRDAGSSSPMPVLWSALIVFAVAAAATAWYRAGTAAPADPAPVTSVSAPTTQADAPAVALVAATAPEGANTADIELATAATVPQTQKPTPTETGNVAAADATEGELRITSEPTGAMVTVNGVGWGPTPVTIRYMPFGRKVIRATKPGYVGAQRGFDFVPNGRARSIRIQLSPESPDTR
jgi:cytoskeletal protein RodZ